MGLAVALRSLYLIKVKAALADVFLYEIVIRIVLVLLGRFLL